MRRIHAAPAQSVAPRRRRCGALLAAALLAAALLTSFPAAASPAPLTYRIGVAGQCDGVDPFASRSPVSRECLRLGYDCLTGYDADYRPVPDIAESWAVSSDGTTWTFHVREGMTWHDGLPLTAHDVAFTYRLILRTQEPTYSHYLAGVESVTAPDDGTVVIVTRRPRADLLGMAVPILPRHVWADADPDAPGVAGDQPFVGSGPFRISDVQSGSVRLEANDAYPDALGGRPTLDEVHFVVERDADALVEAYRAGSLDAVVGYPPEEAAVFDDAPGTTAVAAPAIGAHELSFNCWNSRRSGGDPLLLDPSVRRAVHWAIDTEKLVAAAAAGLAVPGTSLLSPAQLGWRWEVPEAAQYRYDPVRAKRILEDAGYADRDGDGVREDAASRPLSFRLVAFTEHPEEQAAARMIVRWCRDVGVEFRLQIRDEAGFRDDLYARADYDALIWSRDGAVDPGFVLAAFTTARIGDGSETRYSDPLYDGLYAAQREALDPDDPGDTERRKTITDAMQKFLYRDDPSIVLWYTTNLQAYRSDSWTGYAPAPAGAGAPFWNQLSATYLALRPLRAPAPDTRAPVIWPWVAAATLAVAGAAVLALLRRRRPGAAR